MLVPTPCILSTPLSIMIPRGGMHLSCPLHPEGHKIYGSETTS